MSETTTDIVNFDDETYTYNDSIVLSASVPSERTPSYSIVTNTDNAFTLTTEHSTTTLKAVGIGSATVQVDFADDGTNQALSKTITVTSTKAYQTLFPSVKYPYLSNVHIVADVSGDTPYIKMVEESEILNSMITFIGLGGAELTVDKDNLEDYVYAPDKVTLSIANNEHYVESTFGVNENIQMDLGFTGTISNYNETYYTDYVTLTGIHTTFTISGDSLTFDACDNELTTNNGGESFLQLSADGNTNFNEFATIQQKITIIADNGDISETLIVDPSDSNVLLVDASTNSALIKRETNTSDISTILSDSSNAIVKKDITDASGDYPAFTYSIPVPKTQEQLSQLRRVKFESPPDASGNIQEGHVFVKEVDSNIAYMQVTLEHKDNVEQFDNITSEYRDLFSKLPNTTPFISVDKYKVVNNSYVKDTDTYVKIRVYHPYNRFVGFHIANDGSVNEINTTNFPDSEIVRDATDSDYWFVTTKFSSLLGSTQLSGASSGDPHIFPILGNMYELPFRATTYRMLQGKSLIVNASTRFLRRQEKKEIKEFYANLVEEGENNAYYNRVTNEGVFYNKVYIECDGRKLEYDFDKKKGSISQESNATSFFQISRRVTKPVNKYSFSKHVEELYITFESKHYGEINLRLQHYSNPQVKYGIVCNCYCGLLDLKGLLIREYKVKTMECRKLRRTKPMVGKVGKNKVKTFFKGIKDRS